MDPDQTGGLPVVEAQDPADLHCHRCGAPHDRFQEYCLECGARLVPIPQFGGRGPGSPFWFWVSLLALLVIALATAAVVIAATGDDEGTAAQSTVQTLPVTVVPTGLTTLPLTEPTLPTTSTFVPTVPTTTFTTTTTPTTTAQTTTNGSGLTQWPAGQTGWTAILESVPASQGKAAAEAKAEQALAKGLTQVGVLKSDDYEGLTPGYWVVFSGVKNTKAEAQTSVASAKSAGYPSAYPRQIIPN